MRTRERLRRRSRNGLNFYGKHYFDAFNTPREV